MDLDDASGLPTNSFQSLPILKRLLTKISLGLGKHQRAVFSFFRVVLCKHLLNILAKNFRGVFLLLYSFSYISTQGLKKVIKLSAYKVLQIACDLY